MNGEIFSDASMLEIFRAEVETHVESLTAGLLALERDPGDTSHIDEMMRGAHSIKGAARIVGIDPAVRIAHVMEDGFVATQNGKLTLQPDHVDVLLRGVDMLNRIANGSKDPAVDWKMFDTEAAPLVAEITAVLAGTPAAPKAIPHQSSSPPLEPGPVPSSKAKVITISLPNMFDANAAEIARRALIAALDAGERHIQFDLVSMNDLDAVGLAFLVAVPPHADSARARVELMNLNAELQEVFAATGIDTLYPSEGG